MKFSGGDTIYENYLIDFAKENSSIFAIYKGNCEGRTYYLLVKDEKDIEKLKKGIRNLNSLFNEVLDQNCLITTQVIKNKKISQYSCLEKIIWERKDE